MSRVNMVESSFLPPKKVHNYGYISSMVQTLQFLWACVNPGGDRPTAIIGGDHLRWWLSHPSEQYDFVSWDDEIPNNYNNYMGLSENRVHSQL